ncbi:MAG TPA: aldo/keto reductase [Chthonomonadaceae bacterium]|nr:aldo/keto reductase [Chthonomonadaceae bacterium]
MERRVLGHTGRELSILGMGGVVLVGMTQAEADAIVREAIDRGINYFDVAPSYGRDQETEKRLGPALKGHRENVFLACKTMERTAAGAREELRRSLSHLRTDYLDLYQLHALSKTEEVETIFGPGGAIEAFLEARETGLVRYLGFSAHSEVAALDAMDRFTFDTALFPINFVTYYAGGFGPRILARAQEQGVARLALKSMARTNWPEGASRPFPHCWYEPIADPHLAGLALRFTLSEPITAAIPPGDPALFRMALDLAESFRPLTPEERADLQAYARTVAPIFQTA